MVMTHESGTALGSKAFLDPSTDVLSYETWMGGTQRTHIMPEGYPISYEGDKPLIAPALMTVGHAYLLMVYGEPVWVIKDLDETINFYGLLGT